MVLEMLVNVKDAIRNPWKMTLFGAVVSVISLGVSYFVFPENVGLLTVFLITLIAAPFMWKLFRYEEWHDEAELRDIHGFSERFGPGNVFGRHMSIFIIYVAFFSGIVIALSLAYWALPDSVAQSAFDDQTAQIQKISRTVGAFTLSSSFTQILSNNLIVMFVSFMFALLFGIGAIFVLAWNASVLAAAIGTVWKTASISTALIKYLPHGVFEIAGFFFAAIAGGTISVAIMKRRTRLLGPVLLDMFLMLILGGFLILVAAFIESSSFI